ncbi:MAG TPA: hypothetical protein VKE96_22140 [Vicinamibacterales bacterium]|nr:hypothetical protein [Vicinamibacterales bacterium]
MASVLTLPLYFGLARRRGYTTASYVLALTLVLAMTMSALFEAKRWGALSLLGIALVLASQWMLLRVQNAKHGPSTIWSALDGLTAFEN